MPGGSPGGSTASSPTSTSRAPASNVARSPSPRRIPPPSPPAPRPECGLAALRIQRDEGVVAGDEESAAVGDQRRVAGGGDREVLLVGVDVEADRLAGGEAGGEDLVGDDGRDPRHLRDGGRAVGRGAGRERPVGLAGLLV